MPGYSVVMPAYNAQAFIGRALQSLSLQRMPVDEIIVVDDGSLDRTVEIVRSWHQHLPLRLLRNGTNRGIAATLRRGVEAASGDWVLRLDADDRWLPDHVRALDVAAGRPGVCLVTSPAYLVNDAGERLGQTRRVTDASVRKRLMWDNPLIHSATGFSLEAYRKAGGYREGVRWEDYDLWIRLLAHGRLGVSEAPGIEYTVSGSSLSRTRRSVALAARWRCQRQAIAAFGRRHPLAAARSFMLGAGRASYSSLSEKFVCG